jgi:hypothetical protein
MGFFAPLISAFGALSTASKLSLAGSVISGVASYKAAKKARKQTIADQDNQYVRMRDAAQRAGFNPLTVLRATGGAGFNQVPTFSKAGAFGNTAAGILDVFARDPIQKIQMEQRQAELENTRVNTAYTGILAKQATNINQDIYAGYDKYIPVRVGDNIQQLEITVAKRMGISPNDMLTAEDLAMIKGEVLSEAEVLAANRVRDAVLIPAPLGGSSSDTNINQFVGMVTNAINSVRGTHNKPTIPPFSDPSWNNEYKKYVN